MCEDMKKTLMWTLPLAIGVVMSSVSPAKAEPSCDLLVVATNFFCDNDYYPDCWDWYDALDESGCLDDAGGGLGSVVASASELNQSRPEKLWSTAASEPLAVCSIA
jgi:hypothetical protein